jgi:predicted phage terminase large subunit-like protein
VSQEEGPEIPIWFEQEPGSSGKLMINEWSGKLPGFAVRGLPSMRDKVTRAEPIAARAEQGAVRIVGGPWVTDFLDEAEDFPEGDHDDQVDAVSGGSAAVKMKARVRRYRAKAVR